MTRRSALKHGPIDSNVSRAPALTRRHFAFGLLAGACSAVPGVTAAAHAATLQPAPQDPLAPLHLARFEPLLGERFRVWNSTRRDGELQLIEASALDVPAANQHLVDPTNPGFSLYFKRANGQSLAQATYRLTHWRFGSVDLFLVPMRSDKQSSGYEAIIQHYLVT